MRPANEDPEARLEAAELAGRVIFAGYDWVHGLEPWATDGTPAGTVLLADIGTGGWDSAPTGFVCIGDGVVFGAQADGLLEGWLWKTEGTPGGTFLADLGDSDEGLRGLARPGRRDGRVRGSTASTFPVPTSPSPRSSGFTDGSASGTAPARAPPRTPTG